MTNVGYVSLYLFWIIYKFKTKLLKGDSDCQIHTNFIILWTLVALRLFTY